MSNADLVDLIISDTVSESQVATYKRECNTSNLSEAELLSILLLGKKETRIERAKSLLEQYGGLCGMAKCYTNNPNNIEKGDIEICRRLMASVELTKRCLEHAGNAGDVFSSPQLVRDFLSSQFIGKESEVFGVMFLDNRHRLIEYRDLFHGTIDSAAVYPREVLKHCLSTNSAAVIFSHNHPSGVAEPSDTDVRLTRKLTDALSLIDVRVLDHLIIGHGTATSMAERGLM